MKSRQKKELIEHMVEQLRGHQLPYKEGAWERFAQGHGDSPKASKPVLWRYAASVAAAILLGFGLFMWYDAPKEIDDQFVAINSPDKEKHADKGGNSLDKEEHASKGKGQDQDAEGNRAVNGDGIERGNNKKKAEKEQSLSARLLAVNSPQRHVVSENSISDELLEKKVNDIEGGDIWSPNKEQLATADIAAKEDSNYVGSKEEVENTLADASVSGKSSLEMMLEKDSFQEDRSMVSVNKADKSRKWGFGVVVSPVMTEEKVNLGGGVTLAYQISDKLSVGSGLSVVDLNVANNSVNGSNSRQVLMNAAALEDSRLESKTMAVVGQKELTSISSNVIGLDIPIDFKYNLMRNLYVGAGASVFTVLRENRFNNYVSQFDNSQVVLAQGLAYNSVPEIRTVRTTESTAETPLKESGYSTFLNFSVGQKIPLSSRIGLSVEPFYKLPVGRINNQNMNFQYGGVRIVTSF
ncbi:hypothetical protein [Olivibacter sitiensis]|uniref:hypothetical protein n=1 Tax=Olivibacter sitiensis TaxID=376470 RepID=UPI0003FCA9D0|nr:hypothetical protein [Olivibacter sitiensis]